MLCGKIRISLVTTFLLISYHSSVLADSDDVGHKKMAKNSQGEIKKISSDDKAIVTFIFENDLFTGSDLGYTNGVRFSYVSPEKTAPKYLKQAASYLPIFNDGGKKRVGGAFGQSMYTPSDITQTEFGALSLSYRF